MATNSLEYMRQWRARNPDYNKKRYVADPEQFKRRAKQYRESNQEKYREQKARYRTDNATKENDRIKKWNEENPDRADIQNAKRILHEQTGLAIRGIPADLADAKVAQLKISRWVRDAKRGPR